MGQHLLSISRSLLPEKSEGEKFHSRSKLVIFASYCAIYNIYTTYIYINSDNRGTGFRIFLELFWPWCGARGRKSVDINSLKSLSASFFCEIFSNKLPSLEILYGSTNFYKVNF